MSKGLTVENAFDTIAYMILQTIVEQAGLTQKEAAIYLAALELGEAPVLQIAKKAEVKRPTAYVILEELKKKGFVHGLSKGNTTLFQATPPERVLSRFDEGLMAFRLALPQLQSIANAANNKPKVRFYEGKKNVFSLYIDEIFCQKNIIAITSMKEVYQVFSKDEMQTILKTMQTQGTTMRDMLDNSKEAKDYSKAKEKLGIPGETRYLPKHFSLEVDMLVYGDNLALISLKNLTAVVIEDKTISSAQRQLLEVLWKQSK